MIKRVVSFALHQPLFVMLMILLFIGGGVAAFIQLPIEAFPDVSDIQVNVITLYPGRAPEEVEKQVTMPIETALNGMPHAVRLFSHTQFGLSYIVVTFDDHTTDMVARQQTLERLTGVDVPPDAQPQLQPLSTAIGEIFRYRVKGDGYTTRELRTLQDWVVDRNLRGVPGVADINTFGGLVKTYEVNPDLAKMRYYGIALQQLYTALGRGNANVGGSKVTQGSQQYLIRGVGMLKSPDEIKDIVIAAHNGTPVLVKDIADVSLGNLPVEGIAGQDKDDDIVFGIVDMHKGDNPSVVLKAIKAKINILNSSIRPQGVKVVPYYDRTWLIDTTLHTVFENLATGAILVTFVLLLFLGNIRAATIVAVVMPLSLLATFIGLTWRGIPANLLSLGAMDFGIIVDGAVIVVENVFRRLGELKPGSDKKAFRLAIEHATVEVGRPTFFSMLIIIAAHIPVFTLQRHEGRIFSPMAWTVTSALVGSLILSLTLVPLLCYFPAAEKSSARGECARPQHQEAVYRLAGLVAGASEICHLRRTGRAGDKPGGGAPAGHGIFAGIERGHHLGERQLPGQRFSGAGARVLPQAAGAPAQDAGSEHRRFQIRPARGRHRPEADQHGGGLPGFQAAERMAARQGAS